MQEELAIIPAAGRQGLETIEALGKTIWNECYSSIISQQQIEYMLERFQSVPAMEKQMAQQGYEYFLLQQNSTPVGYIGLQREQGRLMLSKLYLLAASRGKGYAEKAFAFVEQKAAEHGCSHIWLTVNKHNQRAIRAYEKRGFATIREQVADIGNGYVMDDYVMEKAVK